MADKNLTGTSETSPDTDVFALPDSPRRRSSSLSQISKLSAENALSGLSIPKGSLSRLFTGSYQHYDKDHNYFGQTMAMGGDSIDDLDTFSQISDSGFSDVSHNTQTSVDIGAAASLNCGLRKNASANNLLTEETLIKDEQLLKRNSSFGDLTLNTASPTSPTDRVLLKERAHQKRLSHSMVWNWVKSHQVRIDENTTLDSNNPPLPNISSVPTDSANSNINRDEDKYFNKNRSKISMRDLNAIGPSGW